MQRGDAGMGTVCFLFLAHSVDCTGGVLVESAPAAVDALCASLLNAKLTAKYRSRAARSLLSAVEKLLGPMGSPVLWRLLWPRLEKAVASRSAAPAVAEPLLKCLQLTFDADSGSVASLVAALNRQLAHAKTLEVRVACTDVLARVVATHALWTRDEVLQVRDALVACAADRAASVRDASVAKLVAASAATLAPALASNVALSPEERAHWRATALMGHEGSALFAALQ